MACPGPQAPVYPALAQDTSYSDWDSCYSLSRASEGAFFFLILRKIQPVHTDGGGSPTPQVPPSAARGPPHRAKPGWERKEVHGGTGWQGAGRARWEGQESEEGWGEETRGGVAGSPQRLIGWAARESPPGGNHQWSWATHQSSAGSPAPCPGLGLSFPSHTVEPVAFKSGSKAPSGGAGDAPAQHSGFSSWLLPAGGLGELPKASLHPSILPASPSPHLGLDPRFLLRLTPNFSSIHKVLNKCSLNGRNPLAMAGGRAGLMQTLSLAGLRGPQARPPTGRHPPLFLAGWLALGECGPVPARALGPHARHAPTCRPSPDLPAFPRPLPPPEDPGSGSGLPGPADTRARRGRAGGPGGTRRKA